jgi:hypothetical protein
MIKDEWLTPPCIVRALGSFDLDPCAPAIRPWDTAQHHFTRFDSGLAKPWFGRVWLNPPYGPSTGMWMARLAAHGIGTALVFARTETRMFCDHVWPQASAVLFVSGRLTFHHVCGRAAATSSGAPSVLIAYGELDAAALRTSGITGKFIQLSGRSDG